jgi:hypothetical protein
LCPLHDSQKDHGTIYSNPAHTNVPQPSPHEMFLNLWQIIRHRHMRLRTEN